MTEHTLGEIRAAEKIVGGSWTREKSSINEVATIIEDETHDSEMLAFIEWIITRDEATPVATLRDIKAQALELIEKVRGL